MASSYLWVHVKEARVSEPDPNIHSDVQVSLQIGSSPSFVTAKASSPNPKWEEDVMLTVCDADIMKGALAVELFKPKFLFRRELLGRTTLPLYSVRHSNKAGDGYWINLFLPAASDSSDLPTQHRIRLDMHFELPKDIPPEVVDVLEKRLESLNSILEQESEVLENQEHKIITGVLTPPPTVSSQKVEEKFEEVVMEPVLTASLDSTPHHLRPGESRVEADSASLPQGAPAESPPRDPPPAAHDSPNSEGHGVRYQSPTEPELEDDHSHHQLQPEPLDVPLDMFDGFDWTREDSGHDTISARRETQPVVKAKRLRELGSAPRAVSMDGRIPTQTKGKPLDRGKTMDGVEPSSSAPVIPTVVIDQPQPLHNEGASARHDNTSKDNIDFDFSYGGGSPGMTSSTEDLLDDQSSEGEVSKGRVLWKGAMEKLLPDIRNKRMLFPGARTLSQLVDQLQSYKMKSKLISEQNIGTFSTTNSQFRNRSRSVLDVKKKIMYRKHFVDERVKLDVYKHTLEALLYPASEPDSHTFEIWSAMKPTTCSECNYLLWGLKKQGVKCTRCGKICHERCASLSSQDCFTHNQHEAISDKMHRMQVNHANRFEIMQQAFNYSKEKHQVVKEEVEARVLKMAENYNADIAITVVGAQGLLIPKNLSHRIYVSVAVANDIKKTEVFRRKEDDKTSPSWDEELMFKCYNYHAAIQIRVWNERDSAMAKMANKLTKEGDLFLGQKIIEVRRVGAAQEVWYKLEKRTEKGPDVSGHIKVNISVSVEGECSTPFHQMYIKLHEQMFFHCHVNSEKDLVMVSDKLNPNESECSMQLLPIVAQEVVDEFALRYAIEPIFRMMVHIELLVSHHSMRNALVVINNMLKNLKYQMFIHVAADHAARAVGATTLMEEYMDASNFGRDKFSKLLDQLLNSLRLDLQQYREFYPHKDELKLRELVETFELMSTVIEFQQQAMGDSSAIKASELILESMKECLKNTFDFIVQSNLVEDYTGHPAMDTNRPPFDFFYQIIIQMKSVILEDRTVYARFLPKYCKVNFGDVSAVELWHLFSSTVEGLFDNDAYLEVFPPTEYITLLFTIKSFYDSELMPIPSRQGKVPEFPRWFVRCVQRWLNQQYQKDGMFFLDNAWDDDKNRLKFEAHENQKLSSSAFQMFFYLHQGLEFILSLEGADIEVKEQHFEDFSQIIVNIVQHYVDKISVTIPEYLDQLDIMCMLLNNLQALRSNIHQLFEGMGGTKDAGAGASRVLTEFQQVLSKQLTSWCGFVAKSLYSPTLVAVGCVLDTLMKIKGQGGMERNQVKEIVRPLFDFLAEKLSIIAFTSEQFVLQKVIKEVWYVCMECMHHMLLPMLKWEHEGVQATPSVDFPLHHFTGRQCAALEVMMELLRDFFQAAESQGIKMSTIERGIKQLRAVIALYRETTERLITDYIAEETRNGVQMMDTACGEVYLAVDAYCLPNTGELDGTIRVISATNLKGFSNAGTLRPLIELNFISPTTSAFKKKFVTHVKSSSDPHFNETFKFTLTNWEASELLVQAKHHSTFGKDRVIGIAIVPCSKLNDQVNMTLSLGSCSVVTDLGQAITNVLSARSYDEFAKDFMTLKGSQRCTQVEDVEEPDVGTTHSTTPPKKTGLLAGFLK